jgi:hypothetical protein
VKISDLCARLDVGRSTVAGWLALKDKIYDDYEMRQTSLSKRMKVLGAKNKQIEELLLQYIEENRENSSNTSSLEASHLIAKTSEFARTLGDDDFKCDIHWLNRFRKKHHIKLDDLRCSNGAQDSAVGNHLFTDDGILNGRSKSILSFYLPFYVSFRNLIVNGLESNGENSRASDRDRNGDLDVDNFDVENGYEEAESESITPVPSNDEIRNYITRMRTFYMNKIDECRKFLRQLDDMENNL